MTGMGSDSGDNSPDTSEYYDAFADAYDAKRSGPYHDLVHSLESELLREHKGSGRILECGCGTGYFLERAFPDDRPVGIDISSRMLKQARTGGHRVTRASVESLPFREDCFSLVYSLKVLAHVPDVERALREMARVAEPGGHVVAEFYNPVSIRGLVRRLRAPLRTGPGLTDEDVYYRSDRPGRVLQEYLPSELELIRERGIRILTPAPVVLTIPFLGHTLAALERGLADRVPRLGGFYCVVTRKSAT